MNVYCVLRIAFLFNFISICMFCSTIAEWFHPAFSGIKKKQNQVLVYNFAAEVA